MRSWFKKFWLVGLACLEIRRRGARALLASACFVWQKGLLARIMNEGNKK